MAFNPTIDSTRPQLIMQGAQMLGAGINSLGQSLERIGEIQKKRQDEQKNKLGLVKALAPYYEQFGYGSKDEMLNDSSDSILGRVQGQTVRSALEAAKLNRERFAQTKAYEDSMIGLNTFRMQQEKDKALNLDKFKSMWAADQLGAPPGMATPPALSGHESGDEFGKKADRFLNMAIESGAIENPQIEKMAYALQRWGDTLGVKPSLLPGGSKEVQTVAVPGGNVVTYGNNMRFIPDGTATEALEGTPIPGAPGYVQVGKRILTDRSVDPKKKMSPSEVKQSQADIDRITGEIEVLKDAKSKQSYKGLFATDYEALIKAKQDAIDSHKNKLLDAGVIKEQETSPAMRTPPKLDSTGGKSLWQQFEEFEK